MIYFYPNRPLLQTKAYLEQSLGPNWVAELKKKGDRLVLMYEKGKFTFWNRHRKLLKYAPPQSMLDELHAMNLKGDCQLDGELLHFKCKEIRNQIHFYDLYQFDGKPVREDLETRHAMLSSFIRPFRQHLFLIFQYREDFKGIFEQAVTEPENEGLVLKNLQGRIDFNPSKSPDVTWQIKVRRPEGIHCMFERS